MEKHPISVLDFDTQKCMCARVRVRVWACKMMKKKKNKKQKQTTIASILWHVSEDNFKAVAEKIAWP